MSKKILMAGVIAIAVLAGCSAKTEIKPTIPPVTTTTTIPDTDTTQTGSFSLILASNEGMLLMKEDGSGDPLIETKTLSDGTKVSADRTIVRPDGRIFKLAPGSSIGIDGVVPSGDGLIPDAKNTKGFTMKDGAMIMLTNDGKSYPLNEYMMLNDQSYVEPDGTIRMADGTGKQVEEGQTVNLDGKIQ